MYYNELIKKKYLENSQENNANYADKLFSFYAGIEEEFGKDLAVFSKEEIIDTYSKISSLSTLRRYQSVLRNYTSFYLSETHNQENQNEYDNILDDELVQIIKSNANNRMYISKWQLMEILEDLPNAVDKFLVLALYEGIKGDNFEDIIMMKMSDINERNNTIKLYSGNTIKVSSTLVLLAQEAYSQKYYKGMQSSFTISSKPVTLDKNEYVFRVRANSKLTDNDTEKKAARVYQRLLAIKKYLGNNDFSLSRIMKSGYVYELKKIKSQFPECAWEDMLEKPGVYDLTIRFGLNAKKYYNTIWLLKEYLD